MRVDVDHLGIYLQHVQENFRQYARYQMIAHFIMNNYFLINNSRNEFKINSALDKKDFVAIEYQLRKGLRQLEIYSSPGIKNIIR